MRRPPRRDGSDRAGRRYWGLPQVRYPLHNRSAITDGGFICVHRKRVNVPGVLTQSARRHKEVDNGILISSLHYDLGCPDLGQKAFELTRLSASLPHLEKGGFNRFNPNGSEELGRGLRVESGRRARA
jgi:hypothetical protein